MPRANDRIGPYTLVRELGRGGFGVVWLAERRGAFATTQVALKLTLDDEPDLEAITQESQVWARLAGHPNVLPIIEADRYESQVVIVSEYAPDGSLADWLKRHGGAAPTPAAAVAMASGILAGLEHLHGKGVIHRDLKPGNILLQGDTPRLADFGLSRVLKTSAHSTTVAGTPPYMAPEAFRGDRSEASDVWSAGVLLYQLLAGGLPFPQKDLVELMGAIAQVGPRPLPPAVSVALQAVILRALQKDPARRYGSAAEMRATLLGAAAVPAERAVHASRPPSAPTSPGPGPSDLDSTWDMAGPPGPTPTPGVGQPGERRGPAPSAGAAATPEAVAPAAGDAPSPRRGRWSGKRYAALAIVAFLIVALPIVGAIGIYRHLAGRVAELINSDPGGTSTARAPEAGTPEVDVTKLAGELAKLLGSSGGDAARMGAIRAFEPADLGLKIAFVGKEQAGLYAALGMPPGAVVLGVEGDKPAGRAGIHAGDVIVAIEGRKIDVEDDLRQAIKRIGPGKTRFAIKRGDEARTLVVDCPDCKE